MYFNIEQEKKQFLRMMVDHTWRELNEDKPLLKRMMASIPERMNKIIKIGGAQDICWKA